MKLRLATFAVILLVACAATVASFHDASAAMIVCNPVLVPDAAIKPKTVKA